LFCIGLGRRCFLLLALNKLDDRLFVDDEVKIKYVKVGDRLVIKDANDCKGTKPGC